MNVQKQLKKVVSSILVKMGIISTPYAELKEIVLQLLVESDDNEELENRAFEIITEDGFEEYVNNIDNNSIGTILDCIQFCDSKGGTRLNNPALIRLEWGIRLFGGKTAKELRVGINDTVDNTLYYCAVGGIAGFVGGVAEIGLAFILDAALELPEERPIFMPVLGISVPVLMEGMI